MNIQLLGDWETAVSFTNGLKTLQSAWTSLLGGGVMSFIVHALLFILLLTECVKVLTKKSDIRYWIFVSFAFPIYIWMMGDVVPAILPTPSLSSPLATSISQAQSRVNSAQASLSQAQKSGAGVAAADKRLAAAQGDLAKLQSLQVQNGKVVAEVPAAFALAYEDIAYPFSGFLDAVNQVSYTDVTLQDRGTQAYLAAQLAASPQLTPAEKAVADQLSQCLQAKDDYVHQSAQVSKYVKAGQDPNPTQNPPRTGKALADAWAAILSPTRQTMKTTCHGMTTQLADALDKSLTPSAIKSYEGGFQIGGKSFLKTTNKDKEQYIAAQMGVPVAQIAGKSPDQISKMFLRYKEMEAVSARLTNDLGKVGTSAAGASFNASTAATSKASGWLVNELGSFGLISKSWAQDTMNFLWYLLPPSFFFMFLVSLIPGQFKRAWIGIIIGMTLLFSWQVTICCIDKYCASYEQQQVNMSMPKTGFGYLGELAAGTYRNLTGGAETGSVVAVGAVGAKAALSATGQKVIERVLLAGADTNLPGAIVSGLAVGSLATIDAAKSINKKSAAFSKLILADGGINPALEALAGGQIEQQKAMVQAARDRSQMRESVLLVFSPFFALILALGGWVAAAQVGSGIGSAVQQIGHGLGQTIMSGISKLPFRGGKL